MRAKDCSNMELMWQERQNRIILINSFWWVHSPRRRGNEIAEPGQDARPIAKAGVTVSQVRSTLAQGDKIRFFKKENGRGDNKCNKTHDNHEKGIAILTCMRWAERSCLAHLHARVLRNLQVVGAFFKDSREV